MRKRSRIFVGITFFALVATMLGADVNLGTWKLNLGKSRYGSGLPPKSETAIFKQVGANVELTVNRVDAQGKPVRIEWVGKFDGKDYPSKGDITSDVRSYRKVDDYTFEQISKKNGQVVRTVTITYSRDGKTRTNIINGTDALAGCGKRRSR